MTSRKLFAVILSLGLLVMLGLWLGRTRLAAHGPPPVSPEVSGAAPQPANPAVKAPAQDGLEARLHSVSIELLGGHDAGTARQRLADLRQTLLAAPANEASAAIRRFLDSKADAPTGLGFKVGGKGLLDEAPTLRTFLLNELERLDPAAAAAYARVVLQSMDSPDDWAVALRSLARGDASADGRALLAQKTRDLLRYEPWQQNPSVGYLEAFDAAVYLGGTSLVPTLAELVRKQDNSAVAHAAFLALDRLVIADPSSLLGALLADPGMMKGREATRADYFARADVRDPQQRQVLEGYLLDPHVGPAELAQFAGVYPNANYMISQNLLTPTPTPDHAALVGRDAESLRLVKEWLNDPRFEKLRPQLGKTEARLEEFVRQAARNGAGPVDAK